MTRRVAIPAIIAAASDATRAAERAYLAIVEKVAGNVSFYSEDGRRLASVTVGSFPHEAVLSPDSQMLYVSVNGVLWMTEDSLGANTISVIDPRLMRKTPDIDLGRFRRPHGLALLPGRRLLATTERPFGLVLVDLNSRRVVRNYDVKGKSPHMVIPDATGEWAFVSNSDSDSVAAVHLATGQVNLIATAGHPQGGALSRGGETLYITATNGNEISIIDVASQKVTGAIPTGKGPARIAVTPDGRTLVYNLQFEPAVGFADTASRKQIAVVPLPGRPLSLTMTRDGRRCFAGIQEQDKVAFVSVGQRRVERVLDVPTGAGPDAAIPL